MISLKNKNGWVWYASLVFMCSVSLLYYLTWGKDGHPVVSFLACLSISTVSFYDQWFVRKFDKRFSWKRDLVLTILIFCMVVFYLKTFDPFYAAMALIMQVNLVLLNRVQIGKLQKISFSFKEVVFFYPTILFIIRSCYWYFK